MTIRDALNKIGITNSGYYSGDDYIIDIENSDEFSKIYSLLDKSDYIEESVDNTLLTLHSSSLIYRGIDNLYEFNLISDWDNDTYKLVCHSYVPETEDTENIENPTEEIEDVDDDDTVDNMLDNFNDEDEE